MHLPSSVIGFTLQPADGSQAILKLILNETETVMAGLSATAIFWFIALGLTVGWVFGYIIKSEGRSLKANITWGITGTLVIGTIGIWFGFGDALLFSFVGSLAVLFIANVFHQHHEEDMFGHVDRGIKIMRKSRK